ncbi:MAG: hypothetical protein HC902_13060, partial [Calothrix sp. SM1_5_4]|nr:hypothetical protein [Calothrix sp. SM1_5_4]
MPRHQEKPTLIKIEYLERPAARPVSPPSPRRNLSWRALRRTGKDLLSPPDRDAQADTHSHTAHADADADATWGNTSGWTPEAFGSAAAGAGGRSLAMHAAHILDYARLREEIENMLEYPGPLGRRQLDGTINARLTFARGPECDWRRSRIEGAHPYFRIYILTLLKKLCSFDTLKTLRLREGQFVDLSFRFTLVHAMSRAVAKLEGDDGVSGNV